MDYSKYGHKGLTIVKDAWGGVNTTNTFYGRPATSQLDLGLVPSYQHDLPVKGGVKIPADDEESTGCSNIVVQCSQETSLSWLKYIGGGNSSTFRRLFWLLIVIGAGFGLNYQLIRSTQKFINLETNTKLKYLPKNDLDFPSVTICNTNMFRLDQLISFYGSWEAAYLVGLHYIRQLFPQLGLSMQEFNPDLIGEDYPGGLSLYDFVVTSAHTLDSMILECRFQGQECSAENFTTTITNFGVCYTFNSDVNNKSLTVNTAGQRQGLSLILDSEEQLAIAAPRETVGFKMLIHPRSEIPNLQDFGIELKSGTHTPVRLDVTHMSTLPSPYGDCSSKPLKYYDEYTESKCYLECETDYIVDKCGCRNFYMPGNASFCSPAKLTYCFYDNANIFEANKHQLCSCPEVCKETIYRPTISQSAFPSNGVSTAFLTKGDYDIIKKAFAELVYESASTTIHQSYTDVHNAALFEIASLTNSNGTTFNETFPGTAERLTSKLLSHMLGNIHFELYQYISSLIFYEVTGQGLSLTVGSDIYHQEHAKYTALYIESGFYKQNVIADAFEQSGAYMTQNSAQTFDEFVDEVYDEFGFEKIFHTTFPLMYQPIYRTLVARGYELIGVTDITRMTTRYMSNNILHVDVFFGDLKVEQISEQPSYEIFQFVCDLGGALGLFFGASLLSFVETADFGCSKRACCGSKKTSHRRQSSVSMVKVKPVTFVESS